ncbi:MAG: metal ABC transporter permease [Phycisphaerae bacterium]|nr:metal ABC transporter permease [Phycisphaerae bacterium]
MEFLTAFTESELVRNGVIACVLASLACGVVGSYVVARRITYIAGGIAHCVFGGLGAACYLQKVHGLQWAEPFRGAVVASLAAAIIIGWVSLKAKQWEDTIIGAMWAIGMAVGVLFIAATPGYSQDLFSYLFGNVAMVSRHDLWLVAGLDLGVLILGLGFYRRFLLVCFDEEFAISRGLNVEAYYLLLLCLVALTVVVLVSVVGIVLVIALLTLPVAIGGVFAKKLWKVMLIGTILSMLLTSSGFAISYELDIPSGATIIVLTGAVYLAVITTKAIVCRGNR